MSEEKQIEEFIRQGKSLEFVLGYFNNPQEYHLSREWITKVYVLNVVSFNMHKAWMRSLVDNKPLTNNEVILDYESMLNNPEQVSLKGMTQEESNDYQDLVAKFVATPQ